MKFVDGFHSISLAGLEFQADEKGVVDIPDHVWAERDASVKFPLEKAPEEEAALEKPAPIASAPQEEKITRKKKG